jgi:hypothetical protein
LLLFQLQNRYTAHNDLALVAAELDGLPDPAFVSFRMFCRQRYFPVLCLLTVNDALLLAAAELDGLPDPAFLSDVADPALAAQIAQKVMC